MCRLWIDSRIYWRWPLGICLWKKRLSDEQKKYHDGGNARWRAVGQRGSRRRQRGFDSWIQCKLFVLIKGLWYIVWNFMFCAERLEGAHSLSAQATSKNHAEQRMRQAVRWRRTWVGFLLRECVVWDYSQDYTCAFLISQVMLREP